MHKFHLNMCVPAYKVDNAELVSSSYAPGEIESLDFRFSSVKFIFDFFAN